ncbi:hypothetical protein ACFXKG_39080 [Streptomyces sp. NPDC059255]|uniref:hypothetical protein n=1 Tax=Streptomyces sp. NPDC059255 TaxID=3346793 RepID=UPI0036CE624C
MISEPELTGEDDDSGQGTRGGHPVVGARGAPGRYGTEGGRAPTGPAVEAETLTGTSPRHRPPWLWAFGGALAASALWAGGLSAYRLTGPDLRGYEATSDLCEAAELAALTTTVGPKLRPTAGTDRHPAVDRARCQVEFGEREPPEDGGEPGRIWVRAEAVIRYTLHKETDPGPEFEAEAAGPAFDGPATSKRIPGLGDQAFLVRAAHNGDAELHVLDGAAAFEIKVYGTAYSTVDPTTGQFVDMKPLDLSALEPELIEDMRALMAALKK